jgi:hypothetical protein
MFRALIEAQDVKLLMRELLTGNKFDKFELRRCDITTLCSYSIDGIINKQWNEEPYGASYIKWSDAKRIVCDIIKGKKTPKQMKLIFSLSNAELEALHPNAKACFINVLFEDGSVNVLTGTSQKTFELSKILDDVWDDYVKELLKGICKFTE